MPNRRGTTLVLVLALGASCRRAPIEPSEPLLTATFVADGLLAPAAETEPLGVGGISAVSYLRADGDWVALSDARVASRFFDIHIALDGARLTIAPTKAVALTDGNGKAFDENVLDPEGLASSPWGSLLVSTEPDLRGDPIQQPKLFEFDYGGGYLRSFEIPAKFLVSGSPPDHGMRHNLGFEALSLSPDQSLLFVGCEASLFQDGDVAGTDTAGFNRILVYAVEGRELVESKELVYPLGPFATDPDFEEQEVTGGLVELVALSNERLLALERIFIKELGGEGRDRSRARVYDLDLTVATNVAPVESLAADLDWTPVRKELVIDLDDVVPSLSKEYPRLDNLEAMGLGAALPGGGRALLLASDDNFRATQRTQFLLLRLEGFERSGS